jgi:hypothetical protein
MDARNNVGWNPGGKEEIEVDPLHWWLRMINLEPISKMIFLQRKVAVERVRHFGFYLHAYSSSQCGPRPIGATLFFTRG